MPVKLTSAQNRIILVVVLVAAASLAIGVKYFWRAFPEASIQFRVNRADSQPIAEKFLAGQKAQLAGYRHAAIFNYDDEAKVYLERTQGLEKMNGLTQGPVHLWRWSHRWFKPQQKEEYRVDVTPTGEVAGFDHEIPEAAAGANLEQDQARAIAENFLRETMRRDLNGLEFIEAETEKRPARTDHSFTWKQKDVNLGDGSYRISVEVDGDQVASYSEFVKVPEQWSRDYRSLRSKNISAQLVDEVFMFTLLGIILVFLIMRLRDHDLRVKMALGFGAVACLLYFLGQLNNFGLQQFGYPTTDSYSSFIASYAAVSIFGALGWGAAIFLIVAGSEPVYRENFPGLISLRRYLSWKGLRTRSFLMANIVGIGLTFFFFAYQTIFYLVANKLGAWAPADVNYSDLLNTRFPWVWVLFMGFIPAVTEEMVFRAFAIPFLRKFLRWMPAAIVVAAFIWGFGHAAYPNQPFYIRGLEVGGGGIIIGIVMLRFGILATLMTHFSIDAIYTSFLLLRSHNTYLMVSGAVTAGIMLVPLLIALIAYWRTGTFVAEDQFTNAADGISRPQREAAAAGEYAPLVYRPLSSRRLVAAGILGAAFVAAAFVPVERFGKGIKIRTTRQEALSGATGYLAARHVDLAGYKNVTWLEDNVDSDAVQYLEERKSVKATDEIYRQATKLVLWHVRFFRPLQKEEHLVYLDPTDGKVFGYVHTLDEDAPGATLTPDQARALAEKTVTEHGYPLSGFDLQNSESQKRKARTDYTLTWQAKPGDPRNVGDAHYRLVVDIAGDQVTSFSHRFKLPEDWLRQQEATGLSKVILKVNEYLLLAGFVGGLLILLVIRLKAGQLAWKPAAKVAAVVAVALALSELNSLSVVFSRYPTSYPPRLFWLAIVVSYLVLSLLVGLAAWLVVTLATSFYPDAWRIFRASDRRVWRRDALVAVALALAAGAGMNRLGDLFASHFHAYLPDAGSLVPAAYNSVLPGGAVFLRAVVAVALATGGLALAIYLVRVGLSRRAWWLWLGLVMLLVSLGSAGAHSWREFAATWVAQFVPAAVLVAILSFWFRDNILAYVAVIFTATVANPLIGMLEEPQAFLRMNGIALAIAALFVLLWLFSGGKSEPAPGSTPLPVEPQ
jgi:membrane protease YdiL (CAAX protease family)